MATTATRSQPCDNCGTAGASCVCSGCHAAWYCNKACQKEHWKFKGHKGVCKDFALRRKRAAAQLHANPAAGASTHTGPGITGTGRIKCSMPLVPGCYVEVRGLAKGGYGGYTFPCQHGLTAGTLDGRVGLFERLCSTSTGQYPCACAWAWAWVCDLGTCFSV